MERICLKCQNKLHLFIDDEDDERFNEDEEYFYDEEKDVVLYSLTRDYEEELQTYVCRDCCLIYVACGKCKNTPFCQLLSHHGIARDPEGVRYRRVSGEEEKRYEDGPANQYDYGEGHIYNVSDLNLYYFNLVSPRKWYLTGPDGGCWSIWKCNLCCWEFGTSDK